MLGERSSAGKVAAKVVLVASGGQISRVGARAGGLFLDGRGGMLARLAVVGTDREDLEPNGEEDGADVEPNIVRPQYGYRPEGDAKRMTLLEWASVA